jgi:hypothetical protein
VWGRILTASRAIRPGARRPDPGAVAILQVVDSDNPPLRLLLGTDAYALAIEDSEAQLAEALEWKSVSLSTDFPEQATLFEQPTAIQEK